MVNGQGQTTTLNPLNAELNPICHLLALLGAHPILHVSRISVNYEISTMCDTKPRTTPQKTSWQLMGPEQATSPKTLQSILLWWWWWRLMTMMILCHCFLKPDPLEVHLIFRNEALVTELWRHNPFKSDVFKMLSYSSKTSYHLAIKYGVKEMSGFWIGL